MNWRITVIIFAAALSAGQTEPGRAYLGPPTVRTGLADPAPTAPVTKAQALAALGDRSDAGARRRGVLWLAESGTMADVPPLVQALRDDDPIVRAFAENALWRVWSRSGDDEIDALLATGVEQMNARHAEAAIATLSRVIERRPDFAEGWNKRATLYYLVGEYGKSLADCDEVLKRNPYHFGALSGYGMNYIQLDEPQKALEYFERALGVNPNMRQVEQAIETLKEILRERRREAI